MAEIDRSAAEAIIRRMDSGPVIQEAVKASAALSTFRRVPMGTKTERMRVLDVLPVAAFVTEGAQKPTANAEWAAKNLVAEVVAAIVPIPEEVFDDTEFNVWNEVRPLIGEAIGVAVDAAALFGVNKPASWPDDIVTAATAVGNAYTEGTSGVDLAEDINQAWGLVEADGFDVNVQYASRRLRVRLRGLRDNDNNPIYLESIRGDGNTRSLMGEELQFVQNGAWDAAQATLIAGDRSKAILGVRQDIQYKILTEATLDTDGAGTLLHLAQQDYIALRAKARFAFQVANPVNREEEVEGNRYPFAVLEPAGS